MQTLEQQPTPQHAARILIVLSLALLGLALSAGTAQAAPPECNDMNVGVPHNAATPIFIDCTGGTGVGSPDVLVASAPSKGTLSVATGQTSTDQWLVYTPNAGAAGADSFTYKGVSPGSGSEGSAEESEPKTVNLRIGAGSAPVCASLSGSVPQNDATHTTPTSLRLLCASGGDPISSFAITAAPGHGTLTTTNLGEGLVGYTSSPAYFGPDTFKYRATSVCGAAWAVPVPKASPRSPSDTTSRARAAPRGVG